MTVRSGERHRVVHPGGGKALESPTGYQQGAEHVMERYDGCIGEAWAGDAPNGVHINLTIASRGSAAYAATLGALAGPSPGHVPFLVCLGPGNMVRPATIVVNKTTIETDLLGRLTWGAGQLGIAQGVCDALAHNLVDAGAARDCAILVLLWLDAAAGDETAVRLAAREATCAAIRKAVTPISEDEMARQLRTCDSARNGFYTGD